MSEVLKYLYLCRISRLNTVPYSDLRKAAVIVVKTVMGDSYYSDAESFLISFWRNCMYFFMLYTICVPLLLPSALRFQSRFPLFSFRLL